MTSFNIHYLAFAILYLFVHHVSYCQINQKIYFDKQENVTTEAEAEFYIIAQKNKTDESLISIKGFYTSGAKKSEGNYLIKNPVDLLDLTKIYTPEFWHIAVNEGSYIEWYRSGKVKAEGFYSKGFKEGIYKRYYESGKIFSQSIYKDEKANGMVSIYNENGTLDIQFMMVDDQIHGEMISFFANGKKSSSQKFKNNVKDGEAVLWHPDGEIIEEQ